MMSARVLVLALFAVAAPAIAAQAQLAATVPSSDLVYDVVEELSASLGVRGFSVAQRPWSRREVALAAIAFQAAIARELQDTTAQRPPVRIVDLAGSLAANYDEEIRELRGETAAFVNGALVRQVRVDATITNSAARPIPSTNGLGMIDAVTNPLVEPNWGRPIADGFTGSAETLSEIGLGTHVALGVEPRVSWLRWRSGTSIQQSDFQRLYARGVLANVAIEAGLDEVTWGEAGARGLLFSANPRPLHAITVGNDTGIVLPWVLRLAGPVRARILYANLGTTQNFPGAQVVTYGLEISPTTRLDLGAALFDQMGGGGSPRCSIDCRIKDLFPYVLWILKPGSDSLATNKIAQLDARYRIPDAMGLSVYYELSMDDFDARRLGSTLWQDSGNLLGLRLDRLDRAGRWAIDLQAHHTSLRLYEHTQFTSGVTYRRAILGDPLGTNGKAGYAKLMYRPSTFRSIELTGAWESRDPSTYTVTRTGPHDEGWRFVVTQKLPAEDRARVGLSMPSALVKQRLVLEPSAIIERVHNENFVAGNDRTNFLIGITGRVAY